MTHEPVPVRHAIPLMGCVALVATSLVLSTHHLGWFLRDIDAVNVFPFVLTCVILPFAALIVGNTSAAARRVMFLVAFLAFQVSAWFSLLLVPNAMTPQQLVLDPWMTALVLLPSGTSAIMFMVSIAWFAGLARAMPGWPMLAGACFATCGLLVLAFLPTGVHGWLMLLLPAALLVPAAVMLRFGLVQQHVEDCIAVLVAAPALKASIILDSTRGMKIVLFTIACVACTAVSLGLPVMGAPPVALVTTNALFFAGLAPGALLAAAITRAVANPVAGEPTGPGKDARSQVMMLVNVVVIMAINLPAFLLNVYVPGAHGSPIMHVLLGMACGMNVIFLVSIAIMFHPPRSFSAFMMLVAYLVFVGIVLAGILKAMPVSGDIAAGIGEYAYIIVGFVAVVAIPCIVACIVSWRRMTARCVPA